VIGGVLFMTPTCSTSINSVGVKLHSGQWVKKGGTLTKPARGASAPEKFLVIPEGKEEGRKLSPAPTVEGVHSIVNNQKVLTFNGLYGRATSGMNFDGMSFSLFRVISLLLPLLMLKHETCRILSNGAPVP